MDMPKFHETFIPILDMLADGKITRHRELLNKIVDKYYSDLPKELLEKKTKSGDLLILYITTAIKDMKVEPIYAILFLWKRSMCENSNRKFSSLSGIR